ncbi:MAG: acyltransferase family protein [Pseudomonadales bacterium]
MSNPQRFVALDVFRGIAIAAMILVNTPGSWDHIYAPLAHSEWHGCTPTDLIFPFFLFITGSAMVFAFRKYEFRLSAEAMRSIGRRMLLLFLIGLFLNWFGFWADFAGLRIMGVLQRIGLAYGLAAVLVLSCSHRQLYLISAVVLLGYWLLLAALGGADPYSLEANIVRQVDIAILDESHMWHVGDVAFDPEGLLSTLPASISVVLGYLATHYLVHTERAVALRNFVLAGLLMAALAWGWNQWLPINKSLWTGSYVLFTTASCLLLLVLLVWLVDVLRWNWLAKPLQVYGLNPLFVYALSWMFARLMAVTIVLPDGAGATVSAYDWCSRLLAQLLSPHDASLLFALLHVLLFWLVSLYLYRRNIVIKI